MNVNTILALQTSMSTKEIDDEENIIQEEDQDESFLGKVKAYIAQESLNNTPDTALSKKSLKRKSNTLPDEEKRTKRSQRKSDKRFVWVPEEQDSNEASNDINQTACDEINNVNCDDGNQTDLTLSKIQSEASFNGDKELKVEKNLENENSINNIKSEESCDLSFKSANERSYNEAFVRLMHKYNIRNLRNLWNNNQRTYLEIKSEFEEILVGKDPQEKAKIWKNGLKCFNNLKQRNKNKFEAGFVNVVKQE